MSLQHIVKNGLKDISLDVKDLNCESITVNNLPIESFDQDLNTTDDVTFNKLTLTSTMFTDPNQAVNKDYVDNSAPGTGSLQSAYNGGNTILTAPGFPIELTGTDGLNLNSNPITTGKLTFPNSQELVSKQFVLDEISNIPSSTTLQDAYDNGSTIVTTLGNNVDIQGALDASSVNTTQLSSSSNLTIGVSSQAQILAQSLLLTTPQVTISGQTSTQQTSFTDPQNLVTKSYVDTAISAIPPPTITTSLQDAYDNGSGQIALSVSKPLEIIGNEGLLVNNNPVLTTKLTFTDPQELVSKAYADSIATSQPNQSITWSLQGVLDEYDTLTSVQTIPLSSVVSGNLSVNYPGVGDFQELNPTVRAGNILTVPSTAWYSIRMTYSHPSLPILGSNTQAGLGSDCKVFIKINGSNRIPLGQEDSGAGITESISVVVDRYLTANSTIEFEWQFGSVQANEDFFINCSIINQTKSITLSDFSGSTPTLPGVEGLVPAPLAGQQFATLLGSGSFLNLSAPAIIDMYGQVILDWTGRISPGLVGLNIAGSTQYLTLSNNYFLSIVNAGNQTGYINFDAGQSYDKFKFEVYYKILNTTQPADILGFFGCGTQVNTGDINSTNGLTFNTDYFSGGTYNSEARITDGTGGIITPYQLRGYQDINSSAYNKMTMTRFNQNVTIDIEGFGGRYSSTASNFTPTFTGTRFGILAGTGGSSMSVEINSIKLTAF